MGKHRDISADEHKILDKYLYSYSILPKKSEQRNQIVNQAFQELNRAGFQSWDQKNIITYFNNNNKKTVDNKLQIQQKSNSPKTPKNSQSPIMPAASNINQSSSFYNSTPMFPLSYQINPLAQSLNTSLPKEDQSSKIESACNHNNISSNSDNEKNDDEILTGSEFVNESQIDFSISPGELIKSTEITTTTNTNSKSDEQTHKLFFECNILPTASLEINNPKKPNFKLEEASYDSDYSCSSSSINSRSNSLNMTIETNPEPKSLDDLLKQLPDISTEDEQLPNVDQLDTRKYVSYQLIQRCYRILHQMTNFIKKNIPQTGYFNEDRLNFQKIFEIKWVKILNKLYSIIEKPIHTYDPNIICAKAPSFLRKISNTTRRYNNEDISAEVSRTNSSSININDIVKEKCVSASEEQEKIINKFLGNLIVDSFKERQHQNPKFNNFINGIINREKIIFNERKDTITSTIVSYHLTKKNETEENEDILVFEIANVRLYNKSCIFSFKEHEIEIKSFQVATTIYFYRCETNDGHINKFYICGGNCIKEFTLSGFDEYILAGCKEKDFEILETNTFLFGNNNNAFVQREAIKIWNSEIVAGSGKTLYFWKGNNTKCYSKINIDKMKEIVSLAVIEKSKNDTYLAVASKDYPIIYIYDQNHNNILRLISHTMGIKSLRSSGNKLFSGSIDMHVRLWNIEDAMPLVDFNTRRLKISTIEIAFYLGQLFLFVADDKIIQCFNVSTKEFLFYMKYQNIIPKQISFLTGNNKDSGDFAKLVILSDKVNDDDIKESELITIFEF